ncbi:hypothetical protein LTR70_004672 [Exophiala xenobiotica]|uniref:DUF7029 domain-containing protein n=1 Tax=Lithohypha guttulata TaxID=1690604 RepID=A0ABR0KDL3_9EURO|nr:hypothetical protein LTR24_004207 [Lithohypha guttulata]KAK5320309.1 hypothetical protein LTR70_004672 [Exophiala xenobiotica]
MTSAAGSLNKTTAGTSSSSSNTNAISRATSSASPSGTYLARSTTFTTTNGEDTRTTTTVTHSIEANATSTTERASTASQHGSIPDVSTNSTSTSGSESPYFSNTTSSTSELAFTTTNISSTTTSIMMSETTTSLRYSNHTTTFYGNQSTTATASASSTTSSSAYGPGSEFELEGPLDLGSIPPTILDPVSPPDIDMGSLDRIDAQEKSNLWFNGPEAGGDEEDGGVTVRVAVEYKYPSIVLDHSIYIEDLECTSGGISGKLNQPLAYERAKTAWEAHPLIFITTNPSCIKEGEASFFIVSTAVSFEDGDQTFAISGTVSELADVFEDMAVDFGKITYECGGFDEALNNKLGYYSDEGDDQYVFSVAAPEAMPRDGAAIRPRDDSFSFMSERSVKIERRGCWIFCAIVNVVKAVVQAVVYVVAAVVMAVVHVVKEVVKRAEEVFLPIIKKVVDIGISVVKQAVKMVTFIATGKYDQLLSLGLNMVPPNTMLEDSPWGDALKFYSWSPDAGGEAWEASAYALDQIQGSLMGLEAEPEPGFEFYCINCGISGQMTAVGSIQATVFEGIKSAQIGVHGNLYAGSYLGVNVFAK